MFVILPILLLLTVPLLISVLRVLWPKFPSYWLVIAFTTFFAGTMVFLSRFISPLDIPLIITWEPAELFPISPTLISDNISWTYAMALSALALGTVLTDVVRAFGNAREAPGTSDWILYLLLTAIGLLGVQAGSLLTLILVWAALDIFELILWIVKVKNKKDSKSITIAILVRVAGLVTLFWAGISAHSSGSSLDLTKIQPQITTLLVIAAGLRLGILPTNVHLYSTPIIGRGLKVLSTLVYASTSLVLLTRVAGVGVTTNLSTYFLIFSGFIGVYAGALWFGAANEIKGLPYWIIGMGALTFTSAIQGQPGASLAWGTTLLLCGGLVFLATTRRSILLPILVFGLINFSLLPFSAAWQGIFLFASPFDPALILILVTYGLLLAGYARLIWRPSEVAPAIDRWVWLIYPWGLLILPFTQFILTFFNKPGMASPLLGTTNWVEFWPGLAGLGLMAIFLTFSRLGLHLPKRLSDILRTIFTFNWFYGLLANVYNACGHFITFSRAIFEGQAGFLWTLLLLTLLISLLVQLRPGG